jgi:GT2 family glycosyltransferase
MSVVYRLSEQMQILKDQNIGLVGSGMWVLNSNDQVIMEIVRPSQHDDILRFAIAYGCPFVHGSVITRKSLFERVGGYKPRELCAAEDFDLWLRMLSLTQGYNVPQPLYYYRESTTQLSKTNAERIAHDTAEVIASFKSKFGRILTP